MIYQNPSTKHEDYLFQIIDQGSLKDSKNNIEYVFFPCLNYRGWIPVAITKDTITRIGGLDLDMSWKPPLWELAFMAQENRKCTCCQRRKAIWCHKLENTPKWQRCNSGGTDILVVVKNCLTGLNVHSTDWKKLSIRNLANFFWLKRS